MAKSFFEGKKVRFIVKKINPEDAKENVISENISDCLSRLDNYIQIIDNVEGWVDNRIFDILKDIAEFQEIWKVTGNLLEIGVYRGRFFFALDQLKRKNERSVAIDIFDEQMLNIDGSGASAERNFLELFMNNVKQFSYRPDQVDVIIADSLSISQKDIHDIVATYGTFRIISIDGGHTAEHTVNDLLLCQGLLSKGGVIFVDDYSNMSWPGVHEGVCRFYLKHNYRVAPVFVGFNKLLLIGISYHGILLQFLKQNRTGQKSEKAVKMFGFETLVAK